MQLNNLKQKLVMERDKQHNVSDDGSGSSSNDSNEQLTIANNNKLIINRINNDNDNRPSVLKNVTSYIIITEFCERLAYYGFAGSLVLFFQTILKYSNAESDIQYSTWSGVCYVTPLLGGYIADTYLGRYKTILGFCILYVIGLVFLVIAAAPGQTPNATAGLAFLAIYLISFGTGGIKPNVSTLGADQFDTQYEQDRREKESFFNYFYWMINLGALISFTLVAYICQYGITGIGGLEWSFFTGFMIPLIMMCLGICIFVYGTNKYKIVKPSGSILEFSLKILYEAIWIKRSNKYDVKLIHILDKAKRENGGSYSTEDVENLKNITKLGPFLIAMIPYWGIYSQMSTTFQNQGCQMNLDLGKTRIPVSALNMFDTIAILLLIPLFDFKIYPFFKRIGYPMSMLFKIGLGFVFAALSMLVAAFVEISRKKNSPEDVLYINATLDELNNVSPCQNKDDYNPYMYQQWFANQNNLKPTYCIQICDTMSQGLLSISCIQCNPLPLMSRLSVFAQIPQFMLIGISEILSSITSLEFFYSQAPSSLRSICQSLNLATTALGSWLVIPLVLIVNATKNNEWITTNINDGKLQLYFILLAILMVLDNIYLIFISKNYKYNDFPSDDDTSNLEKDDNIEEIESPMGKQNDE